MASVSASIGKVWWKGEHLVAAVVQPGALNSRGGLKYWQQRSFAWLG